MIAFLQGSGFFILCVLYVDCINIIDMRRILRDMVVGNRNLKSERRIYKGQSLRQKVLLSYIQPYLKQYQEDYKRWLRRYYANLVILLPESTILLWAFHSLSDTKIFLLCAVLGVCKITFTVYMHFAAFNTGFSTASKCARADKR